jgi:hypothetical protein
MVLRRDFAAIAFGLLLTASCSVIFDGDSSPSIDGGPVDAGPSVDTLFTGDDKPLYSFDFRPRNITPLTSRGSAALSLELRANALLDEGGLLLLQSEDETAFDHAKSNRTTTDATERCEAAKAVTVAAWITAGDRVAGEELPGRIFSMENHGASETGFTLGQTMSGSDYDVIEVRVGNANGNELAQRIPTEPGPFFVFYTSSADGTYRYQVDDELSATGATSNTSTLWEWADMVPLTMGVADNLTRPWRGTIHTVDFFCRQLDEDEQAALRADREPN